MIVSLYIYIFAFLYLFISPNLSGMSSGSPSKPGKDFSLCVFACGRVGQLEFCERAEVPSGWRRKLMRAHYCSASAPSHLTQSGSPCWVKRDSNHTIGLIQPHYPITVICVTYTHTCTQTRRVTFCHHEHKTYTYRSRRNTQKWIFLA